MGPRLRRLEPAPAAGVGRRGGLARPRAPRGGSPQSSTAQHGSGGAVAAPMRRRTGRSLPGPCPAAPNRSGDGAPAPVHGSVGLVERVPQVELAAARRVVDAGLALVLGRDALALAGVVGRAPIAR